MGGWDRWPAREISELTVGVVGLGAIGRKVASMFTVLGARVIGYDPFATDADVESASLRGLLKQADIVSLHAPPPDDGAPLIDGALLELLPVGAVLINTARASLVDDRAVLAALDGGRLSAYAVDAFATEPPEPTPLLRHARVLATPHLGAFTTGSVSRATSAAVASILNTLGE
jgi:D-3-phosphoglycerate dehydrogenase